MNDTEATYDSNERGWGAVAHLAALCGVLVPLGNILGPLVVWLAKRRDSELVDAEGKEAMNFQITITLSLLLCIPAVFIGIGGKLFLLICAANVFFIIKAALHASKGDSYSYPLTMRLIG
jgi:uncharacterized Tic20 family protein